MKQYISKLFMLLAVVLGFAACTDADMEPNVTYDEHQPLTSWQSEYLEDSTEYNLSYSIDAKGDTTCTMTFTFATTNPDGFSRFLCTDGKVSYDKATGMTVINFATTPFGVPVRVYSILQSNKVYSSVQVFLILSETNNQKLASFRAINTKPELKGQLWVSNDESYAFIFDEDGKVTYQIPNKEVEEGTYTYDITTGNGTITLADGTAATLSVNALNQEVFTYNGVETVLYPSVM